MRTGAAWCWPSEVGGGCDEAGVGAWGWGVGGTGEADGWCCACLPCLPAPGSCCYAPIICNCYNSDAGSLSLDDVVRDLLFEPASLDEWMPHTGRRWEDLPPDIVLAGRGMCVVCAVPVPVPVTVTELPEVSGCLPCLFSWPA
jgi:hypothetical protein